MTEKQALLEQLRRDEGPAEGAELERQKQVWQADLRQLMDQLEGWLKDAELEDKLHVEKQDLEILEEDLDPYVVPSITIVFRTRHPRRVVVAPRSMQVVGGIFINAEGKQRRFVGAQGRIDFTCGASRETLLRIIGDDGTSWRWLRRDAELTEDTFFAVLRELIE